MLKIVGLLTQFFKDLFLRKDIQRCRQEFPEVNFARILPQASVHFEQKGPKRIENCAASLSENFITNRIMVALINKFILLRTEGS